MEDFLSKLNEIKGELSSFPEDQNAMDAMALCDHIIWGLEQTDEDLLIDRLKKDLKIPIQNLYNNRKNPASAAGFALQVLRVAPLPLNKKRSKAESSKLLSSLKAEINDAKLWLENTSSDFKKKIDEQTAEVESLKLELKNAQKIIDTQSSRLDTLVNTAQTTFNEKRSEIVAENDTRLSELRKELDAERADQKTVYETHLSGLLQLVSDKEVEANSKIKEIDTLLGLAGKKSLMADYSKISKSEGLASLLWSLAAGIILASGIGIGAYIIYKYGLPNNMNIPSLVSRIALPFSVFIPGLYCAAKARGHREVQIRARNTGVRLTTLEPFLTKFPEDQQMEIRATLVEEFFKYKEIKKDASSLIGIHPKNMIEYFKELKK